MFYGVSDFNYLAKKMHQPHVLLKLVLLWNLAFGLASLRQLKADGNIWTTFISKTILSKNDFDNCSVNFIFGRNTTFLEKEVLAKMFSENNFR